MTLATIEPKTKQVVHVEVEVEIDKPIPCQAGDKINGRVHRCPTPAEWRVFVVCSTGHDSTQTFCDRHVGHAARGDMQCRRCVPVLSIISVVLVEAVR